MVRLAPILLIGFAPFGGERVNPSWEAVRSLDGETIAGRRVVVQRLPTVLARAPRVLARAVARHDPALVLCVGQAGGRPAVSVERVALNLVDARIPDNAGAQPVDVPVVQGAPVAYLAPLPVKRVVAALRRAGIPAELSQTAGTFVCNAVFFELCHLLATTRPGVRGGFLHIPWLPRQAAGKPGAPSMSTETVALALRVVAAVALGARPDRRTSEGALD